MTPFWSLLLLHKFWALFSPKTKGRQDCSSQPSCKSCQRWVVLVACLVLTFRSRSSHSSSMGFKSADCAGQDINWRMFRFAFNVPLAEFTFMLCVIISHEYKSWAASCILDEITWCCDSRSDWICPSPSANPRLCDWQKPSLLHTLTEVPSQGCISFIKSSPHLDDSI